jgi:hypothetical protein
MVFHCFYAGCAFHGGMGMLRKRLGIAREWIPHDEYIRLRREREQAYDAAERLHHAAKVRRFELYDELRILARIEAGAHRARPTDAAWNALAMVYRERASIEQELDRLQSANIEQLLHILTRHGSKSTRLPVTAAGCLGE